MKQGPEHLENEKEEALEGKSEPQATEDKAEQPPGRREVGGPPGLEPTRYGDWEKAGRCIDF